MKEEESQNDEKRASEKGGEDANQGFPGEFSVYFYCIRSYKTMLSVRNTSLFIFIL